MDNKKRTAAAVAACPLRHRPHLLPSAATAVAPPVATTSTASVAAEKRIREGEEWMSKVKRKVTIKLKVLAIANEKGNKWNCWLAGYPPGLKYGSSPLTLWGYCW